MRGGALSPPWWPSRPEPPGSPPGSSALSLADRALPPCDPVSPAAVQSGVALFFLSLGAAVVFEAEHANALVPPFRVVQSEGASNGICVEVPQGAGSGAKAFYRFSTEARGEYVVWGRAYWPDGCANSFKVSVDSSEAVLLGNDDNLRVWHWVKGPSFALDDGEHLLVFRSREDGAMLDVVALASLDSEPPFSTCRVPPGAGFPEFVVVSAVPETHVVSAGRELRTKVWVRRNSRPGRCRVGLEPGGAKNVLEFAEKEVLKPVELRARFPKELNIGSHRLIASAEHRGCRHEFPVLVARPFEWLVSGPYPFPQGSQDDFGPPFPPERDRGGGWKLASVENYARDGFFDLKKALERDLWAVGYARTWLFSRRGARARLLVGADDALKAWFNGKLVLERAGKRGHRQPHKDRWSTDVKLSEGLNEVLLKVRQEEGAWGFYFRVEGAGVRGAELDELVSGF